MKQIVRNSSDARVTVLLLPPDNLGTPLAQDAQPSIDEDVMLEFRVRGAKHRVFVHANAPSTKDYEIDKLTTTYVRAGMRNRLPKADDDPLMWRSGEFPCVSIFIRRGTFETQGPLEVSYGRITRGLPQYQSYKLEWSPFYPTDVKYVF